MSDVAPILDRQLLPEQVRLLRLAAAAAAGLGAELFLVGGTVRDVLLEQRPLDLDLSAVGAFRDFVSSLAQQLGGQVVARSQFGTAKLDVGGMTVDFAIARKESYSYPGALPTVAPGTVDEDLARRDFTINAMAISLSAGSWGTLVDPFRGRQDLRRGLVRVLHTRSFVDDATRILRAVRYAQRLDFRLESKTQQMLTRDVGYLDPIKGDRVRHELERIFQEELAVSMIRMAQQLGVLSAIYPGLGLGEEALTRLQEARGRSEDTSTLLFVAALAYPVPVERQAGLIARLNMDARWAKVVGDAGAVRDAFEALRAPRLPPRRVYELLHPFDDAAIEGCLLSHRRAGRRPAAQGVSGGAAAG